MFEYPASTYATYELDPRWAFECGRKSENRVPVMPAPPVLAEGYQWRVSEEGGLYADGPNPTLFAMSPFGAIGSEVHFELPGDEGELLMRLQALRVEPLQAITPAALEAEGYTFDPVCCGRPDVSEDGTEECCGSPEPDTAATLGAYIGQWDRTYPAGFRWADNPWVWVPTLVIEHDEEGV